MASSLFAAAFVFLIASNASATLVYIDDTGAPVAAPSVLDAANEAVYFSEAVIPGGGQYTVTNNTVDYGLIGFGISNNDTLPFVGSLGSTFDCFSSWCYESLVLNETNWDTESVDFMGNTGFDLFGDISNVLDPGDNMINFYRGADGDLQPGDTWNGFLFGDGVPSSQMFIALSGPGGPVYASGGTPIPEPGTAILMMGGLMGLSLRRRA